MRLIVLYGLPAVGKLTVAKELEKLCGYKVFHNHLVVDLLLSTFEFGSAPFVELREQIWLSVFEQACRSGVTGMIFTFNPERSVRADFMTRAVEMVSGAGGEVSFVELWCPIEELKLRIDAPDRLEYRKLTSKALFERLEAAGGFDASAMPEASLVIDTSRISPSEAAAEIRVVLGL